MKKYIKPNTLIFDAVSHSIICGSTVPNTGGNPADARVQERVGYIIF